MKPSSNRGSVLIVVLILSMIIGLSLVSYIKVCTNSLKMSNRSFCANASSNLMEVGAEEAMYCFNQIDDVGINTAWTGWTKSGAIATRTYTGFDMGSGVSGSTKVYAFNYGAWGATIPVVLVKAIVTPQEGEAPISKYLEIKLHKRSLFSNGIVGKGNVTWSGHPTADSWNSDPDNDSSTPSVPYSTAVASDKCTVGCLNGSIALASGDVAGYAKTGGGAITGGTVHAAGSTSDDASRRLQDFAANFPTITLPSPNLYYTYVSGAPTTLPHVGALPAHDGKYYYYFNAVSTITGSLTITNNVVMVMNNHSGVDAIALSGNNVLTINSGSKVVLYTNGNISTTGNGVINNTNNQPATLVIYGIGNSAQTFSLAGNGQLKAAVYAPLATVSLSGGGSSGQFLGAAVANNLTMNGSTVFHYDEALSNMMTGTNSNPYGITAWRELHTSSERAAADAYFNF